jgi:hypothetical protein
MPCLTCVPLDSTKLVALIGGDTITRYPPPVGPAHAATMPVVLRHVKPPGGTVRAMLSSSSLTGGEKRWGRQRADEARISQVRGASLPEAPRAMTVGKAWKTRVVALVGSRECLVHLLERTI